MKDKKKTEEKFRKVIKTAVFKLHNPGAIKRQALDEAFYAYTDAYRQLLEAVSDRVPELVEAARYTRKKKNKDGTEEEVTCYSVHKMGAALKLFPSAGAQILSGELRDSLAQDVAANLLSYVALQEEDTNTGYPKGRPTQVKDEYEQLLELLRSGTVMIETREEYNDFRNRLTKLEQYRPSSIFFGRVRQFNLVKFTNNTWGVSLTLLAKGNSFGRTQFHFPLELGKWHEEEFLGKGKPCSAFLCQRNGDYFLHVAFEYSVKRIKTKTFLGIDRGVLKQVAWAVVDQKGRVLTARSGGEEIRTMQIQRGLLVQERQRKRRRVKQQHWMQREIDRRLHILTNRIVQEALERRSQVILEDLGSLEVKGKFVTSQFGKLERLLDYKLRRVGLPAPRKVFTSGSSLICHKCGQEGQRDKHDRQVFRCTFCGPMDADVNAAINIARRALYRKEEWGGVKGKKDAPGDWRAFHRSFAPK